jgi:hypothetical protein
MRTPNVTEKLIAIGLGRMGTVPEKLAAIVTKDIAR